MAHAVFVVALFLVFLLSPCAIASRIDLEEEEAWLEEHRVIRD
jgi:hypothetical protein